MYLLVIAAWLITFSFIIDNYWSGNTNDSAVKQKLENYIVAAQKDAKETFEKVSSAETGSFETDETFIRSLTGKNYYSFFYRQQGDSFKLVTWSSQDVLPSGSIRSSRKNEGMNLLPNGYYAWQKFRDSGLVGIILIPIKHNYIVTNDYLQNSFVNHPRLDQFYEIDTSGTFINKNLTIQSTSGQPLFSLVSKNVDQQMQNNMFSVAFRILAALLILLFVHLYASYLAVNSRFIYAVGWLLGALFFLRVLSYLFPLPLSFRQFELFDPAIYGSTFILRSLGDLLINVLLILWFVLFVRQQLQDKSIVIKLKNKDGKWVLLVAGSVIILAASFTGAYIIRSLISDSQISFDVINFFSLNIYSVIGFIVLCCMAISYYFLCQSVLYLLKPLFPGNFKEIYLSVTICGLLFLSFQVGKLGGGIQVYVLIWLLLFISLLNSNYLNLLASKLIASNFIFWLFYFSISIAALIIIENSRKELRNRQHYAEILATKSDPATEILLNSMLTDFRQDFLSANFSRLYNKQNNAFFKDSLISNNFSGYTNRFDTKILSFDNKDQPLFNNEDIDYNSLNTILNSQARPTGVSGLYYYDESYERFSYISKKIIKDSSGQVLGSIFILVNPKNNKTETLYPELFSKGHNSAIENSSEYAFAIYNRNKLVNSHNDYPFSTIMPELYFAGRQFLRISNGGYDELWYKSAAGKQVVIVKEKRLSIEFITLFSYLFCSFLLLTSLLWLLTIFIRSRFSIGKMQNYWHLTIRNQIHGIIIFIITISFIVIGIATILFFISRYENNNREKLSAAINIMENQLTNQLAENLTLQDSSGVLQQQRLVQLVTNISEIHGVDINIYDLNGDLMISSLPLPYDNGIVSTKINPLAWLHLAKKNEVQFFQREHIGKLEFVSNYVPVLNVNGDVYAYLNIPYFTSQSKLKQEISNFLVTIINLNAFIFLIAGIVALFITNKITNSFSLISDKMKKINLGAQNEAIVWERNDEIGDLVKEYNKMLGKLEISAAALAKTEREGAWREMARQVAHEIKNPLTPMKLSMQFLQKSIENNAPNVKQLAESVSATLIEQIDHLSKIANEFSQFANIEQGKNEKIDLIDSLKSIKQLYSSGSLQIQWDIEEGPVYILSDKTHINRLFTNLIQNAIQAMPDHVKPVIEVLQRVRGGYVEIKLSDNGEGIPENIRSKIFTPNFTTKTSGTGLGLAMCKRIVEQAHGKIWFDTELNKGTSFYIVFPLAEQQ